MHSQQVCNLVSEFLQSSYAKLDLDDPTPNKAPIQSRPGFAPTLDVVDILTLHQNGTFEIPASFPDCLLSSHAKRKSKTTCKLHHMFYIKQDIKFTITQLLTTHLLDCKPVHHPCNHGN